MNAAMQGKNPAERKDYDMIDSDEEIALLKTPLSDALIKCRDVIIKRYNSADTSAMQEQKLHRIITLCAVLFGTVAVLFAILQLLFVILQLLHFIPSVVWPMWVEIPAAVLALVAVIRGLSQALQRKWLLERHKAERFRLLKFRSLIDLDLWNGKMDVWTDRLSEQANEIVRLTERSLRKCIIEQKKSRFPLGTTTGSVLHDDALPSLIDYYRDKRIRVQMDYFKQRTGEYTKFDRYLRCLPTACFFLSVLFVFGHFLIDFLIKILFHSGHGVNIYSILLIVLAASMPVVGAGIRTLRSANEFARSAHLFSAKYLALQHFDERLAGEGTGVEILHILRHCEHFLEVEHCEWMRLMSEAEWFG